MNVDLDLAAAYVERHGDALLRARLAALPGGARPSDEAAAAAAAGQRPDGGFAPFWAPDASSLDATCYRLDQIADLGGAVAPVAGRARRFLAAGQGPDGRFAEAEALADVAPPWAKPGDLAATLYLTANCAGRLVGFDAVAVAAAAAAIAAHVAGDGSLPTFGHGHWLAVPVLRAAGLDEQAAAVLRAVERRVDDLGPTGLAWLAGTVPDSAAAGRARARLAGLQQPDGRWASEDGPRADAATTLAALRALIRLRMQLPARDFPATDFPV